jgi:hypothetical protein
MEVLQYYEYRKNNNLLLIANLKFTKKKIIRLFSLVEHKVCYG